MEALSRLEQVLGVKFKTPRLLLEAITHRSYLNENRGWPVPHNQRLEFLGDAVLGLTIADFLFKKFSKKEEGDLTFYRSALVNTESLTKVAKGFGIDRYLLMSKGESKDMGKARDNMLADAVEAIIGAIYLDQGYGSAGQFIIKHFCTNLEDILVPATIRDAKSRIQEAAQRERHITPTYTEFSASGPDHDKLFVVGIFLGEEKIAEGSGKSKKDAEQAAAQAALNKLNW